MDTSPDTMVQYEPHHGEGQLDELRTGPQSRVKTILIQPVQEHTNGFDFSTRSFVTGPEGPAAPEAGRNARRTSCHAAARWVISTSPLKEQ